LTFDLDPLLKNASRTPELAGNNDATAGRPAKDLQRWLQSNSILRPMLYTHHRPQTCCHLIRLSTRPERSDQTDCPL